jgi:hypothetical protein
MKIKNIKRILKEETKGERYLNSKLSNMGPMGISRQISNLGGYGQIDTLKKAEEEFYKLHRVEFKLNNQKYEGYFIVYPQSDNTLIFYDGLPFAKKRDTMYTGGELNKDKSVIFTGSRVDLQLLKTYQNFLKRFNLKTVSLPGFGNIVDNIKNNDISTVQLFFENLSNIFKITQGNSTTFYKIIDDFINIFNQIKNNYPQNTRLNNNVINKYYTFRNNFVNSSILPKDEFEVFNNYNVDDLIDNSRINELLNIFTFIRNNFNEIQILSNKIVNTLKRLSNKNSVSISQPFTGGDKYNVSYVVNVKNNLLPGIKSDLKNQILEFTYISENLIDGKIEKHKPIGDVIIESLVVDVNVHKFLFERDTITDLNNSRLSEANIISIINGSYQNNLSYLLDKPTRSKIFNKKFKLYVDEKNKKNIILSISGSENSVGVLLQNSLDTTMFNKGTLFADKVEFYFTKNLKNKIVNNLDKVKNIRITLDLKKI